MTKRKYKKWTIGLSIVIVLMGWLLLSPKTYNAWHKRVQYEIVKGITPDWIADWYEPEDRRKR